MLVEKGLRVVSVQLCGNHPHIGTIISVCGTPEYNEDSYIMVKWDDKNYPIMYAYSFFSKPHVHIAKNEKELLGILLKLK